MARIRSDLDLTERGEFLFNAAQPVLNEREDFNNNCRAGASVEIAVLGCYAGNNIYIYNITEKELDGIRELTTAHELLHAVYARMSEDEKVALVEPLTRVFEANQEVLGEEIETYDTSEKQEELYVRAGTEIADLPASLEKHYGEVFSDQDKIVAFYNKYIAVFKKLETDMKTLKQEMEELQAVIDAKNAEYERRLEGLNARVDEFNKCAKTEGCFKTETEFNVRRQVIVAEQEALNGLRDEINATIDQYNVKVGEYNENVFYNEQLNKIVNSSEKPDTIK